ncbi:MAG: LysM domain-containing protein [Chloroflexi bacterium]|nr:MAG: LysM domain-containing protein [Chloroflexota bacterium]
MNSISKKYILLFVILMLALLAVAAPAGAQTGTTSNVPFPNDNRINLEPDAPVALYCVGDVLEVWRINDIGVGTFSFRVRPNEIRRATNNNRNTLVDHRGDVGVFRLTSGELQVIVPTIVTEAPAPAEASQPAASTSSGAGSIVHIVQTGENLFRIGLRYNIPFPVIARANNIADPNRIFVGQRLVIPTNGGTSVNSNSAAPAQPAGPLIATGFDYFFEFDGCQ